MICPRVRPNTIGSLQLDIITTEHSTREANNDNTFHCNNLPRMLYLTTSPVYVEMSDTFLVPGTGALEFGLGKKCRKLIFSGYISGLPLIENLSPQKSPLRVLHNLHIK